MTHNQAAKSSICNPKYVTKDLLKLPDNVTITCDDGEVRANTELLSVRSDFFAREFNNPRFKESQEKRLRMAGCSKAAMEAIKAYLDTGEMDFNQLELGTLMYVMNVCREILLEEDLFTNIESYIKSAFRAFSGYKFMADPNSFKLVERFKLDSLWDVLSVAINADLFLLATEVELNLNTAVPSVIRSDKTRNAWRWRGGVQQIKSLPMSIMKKVLLYEVEILEASLKEYFDSNEKVVEALLKSMTKGRFHAFLAWYTANEESCTEEDKREILRSFNFDHFSGEELITVVGLLPREEVKRMVVERFRKCGEGEEGNQ